MQIPLIYESDERYQRRKLWISGIGTSSAMISIAQQDPWLMAKVNRDAELTRQPDPRCFSETVLHSGPCPGPSTRQGSFFLRRYFSTEQDSARTPSSRRSLLQKLFIRASC